MKEKLLREKNGFLLAVSMFTIFPVKSEWTEDAGKRAVFYFPAAGGIIGAAWMLMLWLLRRIQAPRMLGAVMLTACPLVCSGFLHADGFLDCCDALLSHRDRDGKQKILKDPNCAPFAVTCGVLVLLTLTASFDALWETSLSGLELVLEAIGVRGLACWALQRYSPFSETGFAAFFRTGKAIDSLCGAVTAAVCGMLSFGISSSAGVAFLCGCLGFWIAIRTANQLLEGINGDCLGWSILWFKTAFWAALALTGGIKWF